MLDIDKIEKYKIQLSEYRIGKIDKCKLLKNKAQSFCAGYLLSLLLKDKGISEKELVYEQNSHGKPYILGLDNLCFSISHSDLMVALMLDDGDCGIDIERIKPYNKAVVKRIFDSYEKEMIQTYEEIGSNEADYIFAKIWTRKEAIGKCLGTGVVFTDERIIHEYDDEYLADNGLHGYTHNIEDMYALSAFSTNPGVKESVLRSIHIDI